MLGKLRRVANGMNNKSSNPHQSTTNFEIKKYKRKRGNKVSEEEISDEGRR